MARGSEVDAEVAIVGCGPVGAVLAILLAQAGRSAVVLERWPEPYRLPRAVHFDHEVGRILQACGIGDQLTSISEPAEVYEWRNAEGVPLLRFGRTGMGASGWPQSSMFNQPALEGLLEARVDALDGIDVRRGVEVVGLFQDDDEVAVSTADGGVVRARYLVGCDGAGSTVRSLLDLPVHDLGFFYDWLIVDVVLQEPRVFDPINVQICDPARPSTVVSGGPGRRRWEFMRLPHETLADLDDEATAWRMLEPWDVHPGNATLERHAVYTFQARYAERWRKGRVLLAGDAAHQMPPFAGQGMCSGLRDAANLAWKLDLVLEGAVPEAMLDVYQQERMANVKSVIDFSMELGKVICVPDAAEAAVRDEAMAAAVVPGEVSEVPDLPGLTEGFMSPSPHAGELFPQLWFESAAGPVRMDDVVGAGWRLVLAPGCRPDVPHALLDVLASVGGVVVHLDDPPTTVVDARWFAERGLVAALQRPDFHLFGTAPEDAGVEELLGQLRDALGAKLRA